MIAAVLEVAPGVVSYVGMNAIESFGTSFFTKKAVPVIVKTGIGTLVTAKGAFTIFDINENNTGNNLLMDKAFDGDKESYEICEECVDWLCESVIASGGLMPVPPSSLLCEGNDPQDTDGYGHNGRTGISPYAYTGDTDGMDGDGAGSSKSPISLNKDLGNGMGLDTNKKIDPSLNPFSGVVDPPWNGQPDIQLEVFDGDAEGVYIEYQNEGENKKEENSEDGYTKGIYIERGNISLDEPIIDQLLEMLSETRDDIGKKFKRGNVGIAIADIKGPKGDLITNFKSFSQYGNREGYSPVFTGDKKIFETKYVNNKNQENGPYSFDRLVDSEVKIIEDITHQLGYNKIGVDETLEGSVFLLTERIPCLSCQYVLDQFQDMFPNVNVVVIYVYIENTD
ncbi:MAG: hypothetical protein K2O91_09005 [Lachnospiraceae bacterium]|nr:hypothetical protein [Lachnospiraceae bacterium]